MTTSFRPLTGHGFHPLLARHRFYPPGFRPLTGHGFHLKYYKEDEDAFISFRPLTGHGFHL